MGSLMTSSLSESSSLEETYATYTDPYTMIHPRPRNERVRVNHKPLWLQRAGVLYRIFARRYIVQICKNWRGLIVAPFSHDHSEKVGMLPTPRLEWKCLDYWIRLWRLAGRRLGHPGKMHSMAWESIADMSHELLSIVLVGELAGILILVDCNSYING